MTHTDMASAVHGLSASPEGKGFTLKSVNSMPLTQLIIMKNSGKLNAKDAHVLVRKSASRMYTHSEHKTAAIP